MIPVKCSGKLLVTAMCVVLSCSVGFGATVTVDGDITAADNYDLPFTDNVDVGEPFLGTDLDIEALHWGVVPGPTYHPVNNPLDAWYHIGMTVKAPPISTSDGGIPTAVSLILSQGGVEKHLLYATMYYGGFLGQPVMTDLTTPTPTPIALDASNLKYAVNTGLEIAIKADKFNLDPASPFDFKLNFGAVGTNRDDEMQGRVPEPATMSMILVGGLFTLVRRRRRK